MRRWLYIPLLLLSASCAPEGAPPVDGERMPPPRPGSGDAGVPACDIRPEEGCPCEPGRAPVDCYLDPLEAPGGGLVCNHGTQYCRDATWTGCESLREFTIERSSSALVTGPSPCNPCDPRCFVSTDVPGPLDLPGHSTDVSYDPGAGGLILTSSIPVGTALPDGDGDGVPDVADDCPGAAGWYRDATGVCSSTTPTLYHTLPYGASALDPLVVSTQIRTADVYFLMDTTGSMGGELARLQTDLTTGSFAGCSGGIIGAIQCTIPDAWFGVGFHDDYPVDPFGDGPSGDLVYRNTLDIQPLVGAAQTAVNALALHYGNDGPESQTQALWAIATGGGLGTYLNARSGCAAGSWGHPCFRAGTIPIVIFITDAPFHNGPSDSYPYSIVSTPTPTAVPSTNERMNGTAYGTVDITGTWVSFSGSTAGMADNHSGYCWAGAADAVFRVRLTAAQTTRFTLEGSGYDTVLAVFPVSGAGGWCNDDAVGTRSRLDLTLAAGDYYVVVDGYGSSSGAYVLTMGVPTASSTFSGVSWSDTVSALSSRGVKVITVQTCGDWSSSYCLEGENHAVALANATGSLGSAGTPYVFRGNADGSGLSSTIVNAVLDLANYSRMDVSARVVGDTQGFTNVPIAATSYGPTGSCTGISGGTTFTQCLPGTDVSFTVTFDNDVVMPTATPQVFTFSIEIVGDGTVVLTTIPVRIVVPAVVASYPPSGTYWREYDTTLRCASNELPDWENLEWVAAVPAGTRIEFEIRAADTLAAVATATPVARVTVPSAVSPVDLATVLRSAGYATGMPFVRVTAVLYSNATRTATPTLTSMALTYTCVPGF